MEGTYSWRAQFFPEKRSPRCGDPAVHLLPTLSSRWPLAMLRRRSFPTAPAPGHGPCGVQPQFTSPRSRGRVALPPDTWISGPASPWLTRAGRSSWRSSGVPSQAAKTAASCPAEPPLLIPRSRSRWPAADPFGYQWVTWRADQLPGLSGEHDAGFPAGRQDRSCSPQRGGSGLRRHPIGMPGSSAARLASPIPRGGAGQPWPAGRR